MLTWLFQHSQSRFLSLNHCAFISQVNGFGFQHLVIRKILPRILKMAMVKNAYPAPVSPFIEGETDVKISPFQLRTLQVPRETLVIVATHRLSTQIEKNAHATVTSTALARTHTRLHDAVSWWMAMVSKACLSTANRIVRSVDVYFSARRVDG